MKPNKELELEVMSYAFSSDSNYRKVLRLWKTNPWLVVSMYEAVVYPNNLALPLVHPNGVYDETKQLAKDVDQALQMRIQYPEFERAPEGEYQLDEGVIALVNRFGRVTNPEEVYGDEDEFDL